MIKKTLETSSLLSDDRNTGLGARRIKNFVRSNGKIPFEEWFLSLKDRTSKARILARIDRMRFGNFGERVWVPGFLSFVSLLVLVIGYISALLAAM